VILFVNRIASHRTRSPPTLTDELQPKTRRRHNGKVNARISLKSPDSPLRSSAPSAGAVRGLTTTIVVMTSCTAIALALRPHLAAANLAMVYLLGVVIVALLCDSRISVFASFLSVAAFDFFCVPPYLTFQVADYEYLVTFGVMLVVALIISTQTARIRRQAKEAVGRQVRTEALYNLSRRLTEHSQDADVARIAAQCAEETFGGTFVIIPKQRKTLDPDSRWSPASFSAIADQALVQWVFDHGDKVGHGTERFADAPALYLPLKGTSEMVGVMSVRPPGGEFPTSEQVRFLEVFANQTALAIERINSQRAAEVARDQMQAEKMRSSLLSAVSHDLRTPLASITGAASALRSAGDRLGPQTRDELLDSIADEAERLSRLVSNLLDMTRLESGPELRRDQYPLEEIVGAALHRFERQLEHRQVTTHIPEDLPMVYADDVLLGQVLVNLFENAIKYSPEGTPVEVSAEAINNMIILEVRDRGPGIPAGEEQQIFEKFYRGNPNESRGAGLGLAICRAIVEAHQGSIAAYNRAGGGAVFRIDLPVGGTL
jgi:two-component system sensor histidine kinase KdpD